MATYCKHVWVLALGVLMLAGCSQAQVETSKAAPGPTTAPGPTATAVPGTLVDLMDAVPEEFPATQVIAFRSIREDAVLRSIWDVLLAQLVPGSEASPGLKPAQADVLLIAADVTGRGLLIQRGGVSPAAYEKEVSALSSVVYRGTTVRVNNSGKAEALAAGNLLVIGDSQQIVQDVLDTLGQTRPSLLAEPILREMVGKVPPGLIMGLDVDCGTRFTILSGLDGCRSVIRSVGKLTPEEGFYNTLIRFDDARQAAKAASAAKTDFELTVETATSVQSTLNGNLVLIEVRGPLLDLMAEILIEGF